MPTLFPPRRLALPLLALLATVAPPARAELPIQEFSLGIFRIEAEVANGDISRQVGLMGRSELPPQRGMLFLFPRDERHCMWMKNTLLPLSVAFFDAAGRVLNIEDMEPQTENNHCSAGPARYALEMNKGWFAAHGLKTGDTLRGLERMGPGQE